MVMEDDESSSCSSRAAESMPVSNRQQRKKLEVYNEVLSRLKDSNNQEAEEPGFNDELWTHFNRLPYRYALDVNVERAEDVLTHKRLLHLAHDPANRPAFEVRLVQVPPISDGNLAEFIHSSLPRSEGALSIRPPPAFGSSPNLKALALEVNKPQDQDGDHVLNACVNSSRPMHEITFSTEDKPKVLSQLTSLISEIGLNIQEAHAFSTVDGYSLDVFVVDGWPYEETARLRIALEKEVLEIELELVGFSGGGVAKLASRAGLWLGKKLKGGICFSRIFSMSCSFTYVVRYLLLAAPAGVFYQKQAWPNQCSLSPDHSGIKSESEHMTIPSDGTDVWEIDPQYLVLESKIASGSYGDLYKGTYRMQEVAIKFLKSDCVSSDMHREFAQEVYIMRKVRHKNVVQFIGACTKPPSLCIVTEYMSGGSVYDYLHKQKGTFRLPSLLKVAIDISKGMNYLHQNNIIHRDLKAANLLMDENEVVKVADFGVARVKAQTGVMTAETGTYRWMAPEVIEHKPYDHKADVFSFGIVLWELLTGKLPYEYLTPLQAAVGVVQKGLRPTIPKQIHPKLAELLERCWQHDPTLRPDFSEITEILQQITKEAGDGEDQRKEKSSGGIFSVLKLGHH
ncbi:unnamed protein product [Ilex paraguariensis]|uniref:non-specific serine/threonine protein kinase n=1 Tax=Ilex paraguariensis TaxID=185542 RepID=A0ABC8S9N4_9AQUA